MCPTYISTLFEQSAIKLVESGYSEVMIAEFILSINYAIMTSLHPDSRPSTLESIRSGIWAQQYGALFEVT